MAQVPRAGAPQPRLIHDERRALVTAAGLLAAVVVIGTVVALHGSLPGDGLITGDRDRKTWVWSFTSEVSRIAAPAAAATATVLGSIVVRRRHGPVWACAVPACAAAGALAQPLKDLFGHGLPSGHVAYAAAVFGLLGWLAAREGRRDPALLAAAVVIVIGPARLAEGAHRLSEVLAGYALGFGWLLLVAAAAQRAAGTSARRRAAAS